jgi:hypothetical protein
MEREYSKNSNIVFVDPLGVRHAALTTMWWAGNQVIPEYVSASGEPGCNLVYITGDSTKKDPYGLQIERATSVVHKTKQVAPGSYWCWPDE